MHAAYEGYLTHAHPERQRQRETEKGSGRETGRGPLTEMLKNYEMNTNICGSEQTKKKKSRH